MKPTVLDICSGAGGEAIGLEQAGFEHIASIEIDPPARRCASIGFAGMSSKAISER
jgi:DNA (cytosine-5)-methyltransferase 1